MYRRIACAASVGLVIFIPAAIPVLAEAAATVAPSAVDSKAIPPDEAGSAIAESLAPAARDQILDRIAALIENHYVYKDVARKVAAEIRAWKTDPELTQTSDRGRSRRF